MNDVTPLNQTLTMIQCHMLLNEPTSIGVLSPIDISTSDPGEADRQDMIAKGLLDKEKKVVQQWQGTGEVLADPAVLLKIAVASSSGLRLLHGYLNPAISENLVGCTPTQNNEYNLAWPLRKDHILAMLVSGLGLEEDISKQDISKTFSVDALVAMAGFADAIRGIELNNMLARVTDKPEGTDVDQVILSVNEGLFNEDRRWASTLLRDLLPEIPDPKEEKMCNGLDELVAAGWLQEKREKYWVMTEAGRTVFTHWQMVMASAIFDITENNRDDTQEKKYLGMIRTIASLWTVEQVPDREMICISMISSVDLLRLLQKRLEDAFSVKEVVVDSPSDTVAPSCPSCGVSLVPGARFCSKCGGKL